MSSLKWFQMLFYSPAKMCVYVCVCFSHPPRSCMREVLEQKDKVSYYSLLTSLAKHETLNQTIGECNITHYLSTSTYSLSTFFLPQMSCRVNVTGLSDAHLFGVYFTIYPETGTGQDRR